MKKKTYILNLIDQCYVVILNFSIFNDILCIIYFFIVIIILVYFFYYYNLNIEKWYKLN